MAQIVGMFRIGRDAEVRFTQGGDAVASLSLAFNYYDKAAEKNRGSQWVEAALFGKRAESLAQYLTKGSVIFASISDPHIETYAKKDGTQGMKLVGNISEIELAGGRSEGSSAPAPSAEDRRAREAAKQQRSAQPASFDDMDDMIPF